MLARKLSCSFYHLLKLPSELCWKDRFEFTEDRPQVYSANLFELVDHERDSSFASVSECHAKFPLRPRTSESYSLAIDLANDSTYPSGRKQIPSRACRLPISVAY